MTAADAALPWPLQDRRRPAPRRVGDRERTAPQFAPPVVITRWVALAAGIALAAHDLSNGHGLVIAWGLALSAYTIFRTVHPIADNRPSPAAPPTAVLVELVLHVAAVLCTGTWDSPWVFVLVTAVMVGGFQRGFAFATRIGLCTSLAVGIPAVAWSSDVFGALRDSAQWGGELLLVAVVAGYARRLSTESEAEHTLALDRLGRLTEANALLYSLHRVAQTLPASLDLDEVLDSSMARLRDLVTFDAAVLYLFDDTDGRWVPVRRDHVADRSSLASDQLPPPLAAAATQDSAASVSNLLQAGGPGVSGTSLSGVYAALRARGAVVGLLAIESQEARHFAQRDVELVNGFVEPMALAVDNARWFTRLRTIGADEERTRIARDLHDRIGQSLAYLAFELDRIVRAAERGEDVQPPLDTLRKDLRDVIREVRDTLYDLRTDVSEGDSVMTTLESFLDRVAVRSGLEVRFRNAERRRLPLPQEREVWRIAKEAITNVERHAGATHLSVSWRCDGRSAELVVVDDGMGFPQGTPTRLGSYGILGMRERAASIGARLDIESVVGTGTVVRVSLETDGR